MPDAFKASDMQKYESLTFPQTNSIKILTENGRI